MPAVETWLAAASAAPKKAFADAPEKYPGRSASGDDFDHAMKRALAPVPKNATPEKSLAQPGKHPLVPEKYSPAKTHAEATTDAVVALQGKNSDDKTDGAISAGEKSADVVDKKISADANASMIPAGPPEPLPVFLSLPMFSYFGASPMTAGKIDAVGNIFPATSLPSATDKITPAVLPSAGKATLAPVQTTEVDLNGSAEKSPVAAEKNLLLKNLSPVTAAEAAALSAGLSPALEKAAAVADPEAAPVNSALLPDVNGAEQKINLSPAMAAERAADNAGTGVATIDLPMKNSQKTNKVAGPDVKVLPVGEADGAREKNLPPILLVQPVRAADNRGTDLNFAFSNGSSNPPVAENTQILNVVDLPSLADARMRALERTHDMMALHTMRLVESKLDVLSVVIKPAVGTELSLELRQRDGGVEAHATLTRGDHQFLSQHWPELQQRLELRGIKLAPLGGEANFPANDNGNFSQHQASREEAAQQASAFAEFASVGSAGGATARLAVHEGWESWA